MENEMNRKWVLYLALMVIAPLAAAQTKGFPDRPIKMIVPFTAGGGSDAAARFFGQKLSQQLGQPVLVENRPGGNSGSIGTMAVKNAPADGYTILVGSSSPLVINAVMVKDLPYDPIRDFKPLAGLTQNSTVFIVAANSPMQTLSDLVAASKNSNPLNAGTASEGFHLAINWFASLGGFRYTHIPYKGLAQVLTDVVGNNLDWAIADLAGAAPLLKAGRLRALAVTSEKRHPDFPNVPTIKESGYPDYVYTTWTSFHVRSETPDDVTAAMANALQKILHSDAARDYVKAYGTELMPFAPAEMLKSQKAELDKFQSIAASTGLKPQ
jgi:tripartite-type tricarboxylate transporter receptor subunit TctC